MLAEVGLEATAHYDQDGRLQLHMSDLQAVAAAASVAAVVEAMDENVIEVVT